MFRKAFAIFVENRFFAFAIVLSIILHFTLLSNWLFKTGKPQAVSRSFTVKLVTKVESLEIPTDAFTAVQARIPEQNPSTENTNNTPQKPSINNHAAELAEQNTKTVKHEAEIEPLSEALPELNPESNTSNQNAQSELQPAQSGQLLTDNQPNATHETEMDGILIDTSQFASIERITRQAHKAYSSVELQYDTLPYLATAKTDITYPEELVINKTTLTFSIADNQTYKIIDITQPTDHREAVYATSEGDVNHDGLKPQKFSQKFGESDNNIKIAEFSWADGMVEIRNGSRIKAVRLVSPVQDELSYLFQFMFAPPIVPRGSVYNPYEALAINPNNPPPDEKFTPLGDELIHTKAGKYKTLRILKNNDAYRTEIWLAIDYQFLPVKIRRTTGDVVTEQIVTSVSMPP